MVQEEYHSEEDIPQQPKLLNMVLGISLEVTSQQMVFLNMCYLKPM